MLTFELCSRSNNAHDDDDDPNDIETARDIVRPHTTEPLYISSLPLFLSCVHALTLSLLSLYISLFQIVSHSLCTARCVFLS
jgi:hypothetical protein